MCECVCVFRFLQGVLSNKEIVIFQSRTAGFRTEGSFCLGDASHGRYRSRVGPWLRWGGLRWRKPRARATGGLASSPAQRPSQDLLWSFLCFGFLICHLEMWHHQPDPTHRMWSGDNAPSRMARSLFQKPPSSPHLSTFARAIFPPRNVPSRPPPFLNPNSFRDPGRSFFLCEIVPDYSSYSIGSLLATSINIVGITNENVIALYWGFSTSVLLTFWAG